MTSFKFWKNFNDQNLDIMISVKNVLEYFALCKLLTDKGYHHAGGASYLEYALQNAITHGEMRGISNHGLYMMARVPANMYRYTIYDYETVLSFIGLENTDFCTFKDKIKVLK